jgi:hypothetical protein
MESERLEATCPCCGTRLTLDRASGEILAEERLKPDLAKTFEQAMDDVRGGTRRREDAFSKAYDRTQRLDDLLNKKFEEAKKKAATDPGKPRNPFEMD